MSTKTRNWTRDSYLVFVSWYSKINDLHAVLSGAAKTVLLKFRKGLGYCYMIRRKQFLILFRQLTRKLLCLNLEIFSVAILKSIKLWITLFCFLSDFEPVVTSIFKELWVFLDKMVQRYLFRPSKKYQRTEQTHWWKWNLQKIGWKSGSLDSTEVVRNAVRVVDSE